MKAKPFNKMKSHDIIKVKARYDMKFKEFMEMSLDELSEYYKNNKMSSTDRHAIVMATQEKLKLQTTAEAQAEQDPAEIDAE
jgi:hypothetical protein